MEEEMVMVERPPPYSDVQEPSVGTDAPTPVVPAEASAVVAPEPQPTLRSGDVVIVAMGVTGAGKSTFISLLSPDRDVEIGHDLKSTTKHVSVHGFRMTDGRQGWLIDTPGFDDTSRSDTEILREIAYALAELYKKDVGISAILYLHRIIDPKMGHSAIRNLEIFKLLCGKEAMKGVSLVTTRWDGIDAGSSQWESAVERERQLAHSEKYWDGMIRDGAELRRHFGTWNSALGIVESLVQRQFNSALAIQFELAKHGLPLDQTAAGRFLAKEQEELQARYEQEMKDLEEEKTEAMLQKDRERAAELETQEQKYRAQHADFASARLDLHVDLRQMGKENARKLVDSEESAQRGGESSEQIKAQISLLAQNVAELQEDMERQEKEHKEQIARLRKQARSRDKQHEIETVKLIEQMEASHENEKRQMTRKMETLRRPQPHRRDVHEEEQGDIAEGFMKVLRWIGGSNNWSMNSLPR